MRLSDRRSATMAAALLALLMLSYASIRSTVMQVEMAMSAPPLCGAGPASAAMAGIDMASMAPPPVKASHAHAGKPGATHGAACPYCAVAGHLPVLAGGVLLRAPTAVAFAVFRIASGHGPRGPPALQPRARGPPIPTPTH